MVASWEVDPDDVLQEALFRVLARRELSSLDHPVAYLRKTMLNLVRDEQRQVRSRTRAMVTIGVPDPTTDIYPSDLDGLGELTPQGRAALFMAEVEGCSYSRESGRRWGVPRWPPGWPLCGHAVSYTAISFRRYRMSDDRHGELQRWADRGHPRGTATLLEQVDARLAHSDQPSVEELGRSGLADGGQQHWPQRCWWLW